MIGAFRINPKQPDTASTRIDWFDSFFMSSCQVFIARSCKRKNQSSEIDWP